MRLSRGTTSCRKTNASSASKRSPPCAPHLAHPPLALQPRAPLTARFSVLTCSIGRRLPQASLRPSFPHQMHRRLPPHRPTRRRRAHVPDLPPNVLAVRLLRGRGRTPLRALLAAARGLPGRRGVDGSLRPVQLRSSPRRRTLRPPPRLRRGGGSLGACFTSAVELVKRHAPACAVASKHPALSIRWHPISVRVVQQSTHDR